MAYAVIAEIGRNYNTTIEIEWVFPDVDSDFFANITTPLQQGYFDTVLAYVQITDERMVDFDFSCSYSPPPLYELLRSSKDPHLNLSSPEQFDFPNISIAVLAGTQYESILMSLAPNVTLIRTFAPEAGFQMVSNGTVHAAFDDALIIEFWLKNTLSCNGSCFVSYDYLPSSAISNGWVFRKDKNNNRTVTDPIIFIENSSNSRALVITLAVVIPVSVIIIFFIAFIIIKRRPKKEEDPEFREKPAIIPEGDMVIGKLLGKGYFGEVYSGSWLGTPVALKTMNAETSQEAELLARLNSPHIVRYLGSYTCNSKTYMVTELCDRGSLDHLLETTEGKKLTENDKIQIAFQVASGMHYLHTNGILHRDLSLRNILVSKADNGSFQPKISDFGMAKYTTNYCAANEDTFPVKWSPPEVLTERKYSTKSDVWSFAIFLWELFSDGQFPYADMSNTDVYTKVTTENYRMEKPEKFPRDLWETVEVRCWATNPNDRPSFEEIRDLTRSMVQETKDDESSTKLPQHSSIRDLKSNHHIYRLSPVQHQK
eukprot:TRINITY_DN1460_c0_g1_i1.p1 TRINITY_DN1460_c0_g1~~TRINITY_DN1460_c0_g1_i1.p1  ORF type:complete len:541 (+),score=104.56 TRINITY_DN1460_c0_g1_i1:506-2128(+)